MTLAKAAAEIDPLYVIFEQHLYNFQDPEADRKTFIGKVVQEYLAYLRRMNIAIPKSLEDSVAEELGVQVHTMLVKKMYGCITLMDYQKKQPAAVKRKAKAQYVKLAQSAKAKKTG
jgi:hypothetical protein